MKGGSSTYSSRIHHIRLTSSAQLLLFHLYLRHNPFMSPVLTGIKPLLSFSFFYSFKKLPSSLLCCPAIKKRTAGHRSSSSRSLGSHPSREKRIPLGTRNLLQSICQLISIHTYFCDVIQRRRGRFTTRSSLSHRCGGRSLKNQEPVPPIYVS